MRNRTDLTFSGIGGRAAASSTVAVALISSGCCPCSRGMQVDNRRGIRSPFTTPVLIPFLTPLPKPFREPFQNLARTRENRNYKLDFHVVAVGGWGSGGGDSSGGQAAAPGARLSARPPRKRSPRFASGIKSPSRSGSAISAWSRPTDNTTPHRTTATLLPKRHSGAVSLPEAIPGLGAVPSATGAQRRAQAATQGLTA